MNLNNWVQRTDIDLEQLHLALAKYLKFQQTVNPIRFTHIFIEILFTIYLFIERLKNIKCKSLALAGSRPHITTTFVDEGQTVGEVKSKRGHHSGLCYHFIPLKHRTRNSNSVPSGCEVEPLTTAIIDWSIFREVTSFNM